jgi:hypothetical protein
MDRAPVNRGVPLERGAALPHPRSGSDLRQHCRTPNACDGHPGQGSGASVWIILSSWGRRICATSCEPTLAITITSERIGLWTKIRRSTAPFSGSDLSIRTRSWADFTITTFAFRFSVHTMARKAGKREILLVLPSRLPATSQRLLANSSFLANIHTAKAIANENYFKYFCQEIAFRRNLSSWSAAARSQLEDAHPRVLSVIQWLSQPAFRDGEWSTTTSRQK